MGGVSDLVVRYFPRSGFVLVAAACSCVTFFLSALWLQLVTVVVINIVVINLAAVVIWCIGPSILIEEFGEKTFVRDWGFVQLGYGLSSFLLQYLFGVLYDINVEEDSGTCYGEMCFLWIFIVSATLCGLATLLSAIYLHKQRVLMHRHQGLNVRHGLCHIYMRYLYIYELFIAFVCFVVCSLL